MHAVVESLAQRLAWYLKVHAQETNTLRADSDLRGKVKSEIERRAPSATAALRSLSSGEELDACLEAIDAEVVKEPTSFEGYDIGPCHCLAAVDSLFTFT